MSDNIGAKMHADIKCMRFWNGTLKQTKYIELKTEFCVAFLCSTVYFKYHVNLQYRKQLPWKKSLQ